MSRDNDTRPYLLVVIGTRPEAIKLAPVIRALDKPEYPFRPFIFFTGQHEAEMVLDVLKHFELPCFESRDAFEDFESGDAFEAGQSLNSLSRKLLRAVEQQLEHLSPIGVVVQGDTTSAAMAALAAFYRHVPVFHVEAGLRTYDISSPFPEELNRQLISRLATLHFTPTWQAVKNLDNEAISMGTVIETGNTVVDALNWTLLHPPAAEIAGAEVLVTCHRRENQPELEALISAVSELARTGYHVLWPVHPSVKQRLLMRAANDLERTGIPRTVHFCEPLPYPRFVQALARCRIVITDSGGVQEEAPTFGKPVLVFRRSTERVEAIQAGCAKLVEPNAACIVSEALALLRDETVYRRMSAVKNPFGDGRASERIAFALARYFDPFAVFNGPVP